MPRETASTTSADPDRSDRLRRPSAVTVVDWAVSPRLIDYPQALAAMETRATAVASGRAPELVWLLEHPPLYTAGTSARSEDILAANGLPVHSVGRGGRVTYHGPGQRIAYVMLDVRRRSGGDVRAFVRALEDWIIDALAGLGVKGETRPGRVGVWVRRPAGDAEAEEVKIAALGIRIRGGISLHGVSINVDPDLAAFAGIVPCGLRGYSVSSLAALGCPAGMKDVDNELRRAFERRFDPTESVSAPADGAAGGSSPV